MPSTAGGEWQQIGFCLFLRTPTQSLHAAFKPRILKLFFWHSLSPHKLCQKNVNPVSLFANPWPFWNGSLEGQNKDCELYDPFCLLYYNVGTTTNATNVGGISKNNIATVQLFFQREECVGPFVGYLLAHHRAYVIFGQCVFSALLSPPVPSIISCFRAAEGAAISAYMRVW